MGVALDIARTDYHCSEIVDNGPKRRNVLNCLSVLGMESTLVYLQTHRYLPWTPSEIPEFLQRPSSFWVVDIR